MAVFIIIYFSHATTSPVALTSSESEGTCHFWNDSKLACLFLQWHARCSFTLPFEEFRGLNILNWVPVTMLLQREKAYLQDRGRFLFPKENSIRTSILDSPGEKGWSFTHCNCVDSSFCQVK